MPQLDKTHMTILVVASASLIIFLPMMVKDDEPIKQPTVKCTDGKLYDVSYEGNITIIQERPFTTCEETK